MHFWKEEDFTVDDIMKGIENEYKGERLLTKTDRGIFSVVCGN